MLVDLTLLLTGFLLYRPLVRAEGKIADVKGFYYRRLCRILPCYLLAVLVAAAFALAAAGGGRIDRVTRSGGVAGWRLRHGIAFARHRKPESFHTGNPG